METEPENKAPCVIAAVTCDLAIGPLGTRSRLGDLLAGKTVLRRTLDRIGRTRGLAHIGLIAAPGQAAAVEALAETAKGDVPTTVFATDEKTWRFYPRTRIGRAFNIQGWRGGAGQDTVFDEDYQPHAMEQAAKQFAADHILCVPAHAVCIDPALLSDLIEHHFQHQHNQRLCFIAAAPGLAAAILRADVARELAARDAGPGRLLGYFPNAPEADRLGQDASMLVPPLIARLPHRLLADNDRSFALLESVLAKGEVPEAMALCTHVTAMASGELFDAPREIEVELIATRLTKPPGDIPAAARAMRQTLSAAQRDRIFRPGALPDDTVIHLAGDGDPLLHPDFMGTCAAARRAAPLAIHVQTDLAGDIGPLLAAIEGGNVDAVSVNMYACDRETYAAVAGVDLFETLSKNLETLIKAADGRGALPLIVPRLLKTPAVMGQLETFFDTWIRRLGWACIDYPTSRAGATPFAGVVDMTPPRRVACRRIFARMLLRGDGKAAACDQDAFGEITKAAVADEGVLPQWRSTGLARLREEHLAGAFDAVVPCGTCREWHRA